MYVPYNLIFIYNLIRYRYMEVSWNRGTLSSLIHFKRDFRL